MLSKTGLVGVGFWLWTLAGLALFCRGFFPASPGRTGYTDTPAGVPPQFDRLIFMVVDALRSDLVFGEKAQMPFVHTLIQRGLALPFTAFAAPPTVTLPRLKGLTTGASPSFLDAVINIAESDSACLNYDSWVAQMARSGRTLHMFGDDTWLKLFPDTFVRSDGTSSFYVSDYTEVDHNVTRHLGTELASPDWDVLVLHYLGLDHIGHKGGPRSPLMPAKQREMDAVVKRAYEACDDRTLLVVTGDHGMNEVGNHGGSSEGETSAGMILASPAFGKFEFARDAPLRGRGFDLYTKIQQVDVVPTLALLFGIPLPKNSVGLPIADILKFWSPEDQHVIYDYLCEHFDQLGELKSCTPEDLIKLQTSLASVTSAYDLRFMCAGIFMLVVATATSLYNLLRMPLSRACKIAWFMVAVLYAAGMFGSSTVEEEHQLWYWGFTGLVVYLFFARGASSWLPSLEMLAAFRLVRGWNMTGQKWASGYDIADFLLSEPRLLWLLTATAYFKVWRSVRGGIIGLGAILMSLLLKISFARYSGDSLPFPLEYVVVQEKHLVTLARAAYICAALIILVDCFRRQIRAEVFELILLTQSRVANIPLLLVYNWLFSSLQRVFRHRDSSSDAWISLVVLFLQYSTFFASGGSNSLATVDLSNAYNGITSYNVPIVTILTYVSNWVGPLYWTCASVQLIQGSGQVRMQLLAWFYSSAILSVGLACLILRDHLFIWTVFSPKLLYEGAWLVFQNLISDSALTALLRAIGLGWSGSF